VLFACAESGPAPDALAAQQLAVVGGRAETGYRAVGFMMVGDSPQTLHGPYCGATVVAPRVAVTAAHCAYGRENGSFGIGLYRGDTHETVHAQRVFVHKQYNPNGSPRYQHDVAALVLDHAVDVQPAAITAANTEAATRYIGYGRVTSGDDHVTNGYTNERKSAAEAVKSVGDWNLWTQGIDGGLCWGDSGGPLMIEEQNKILGVLADFDQVFYCSEGNHMIFTSLWAERDFINQVKQCAESGNTACEPPQCQYRCEAYGYHAGECRGGWFCDGNCITYKGNC
jgi:secreted trypsin-like serine protease